MWQERIKTRFVEEYAYTRNNVLCGKVRSNPFLIRIVAEVYIPKDGELQGKTLTFRCSKIDDAKHIVETYFK